MLFSYVMTSDTGFAPAVDRKGRFLTLCTCMVKIRKKASEKDNCWVLGTVGRELNRQLRTENSGKAVFLAKVTETLESRGFQKYWKDARFVDQSDRVYHFKNGVYRSVPWNIHESKDEQDHDTSVDRVLISEDFYYFGARPKSLGRWGKLRAPRYAIRDDRKSNAFIDFARKEWRSYKNKWSPPSQPKALLVHVGDDRHPGSFTENGSDYSPALLDDHRDPDLQHLTFGDWLSMSIKFDWMDLGDYIFFNFKLYKRGIGTKWYVTAYYRIKNVKSGNDLIGEDEITKAPYRYNAHITGGHLQPTSELYEDRGKLRIFVGERERSSTHLSPPIAVDRSFWKKLDLHDELTHRRFGSCFREKRRHHDYSEEQFNASYLRKPKLLTPRQTATLLAIARKSRRH